MRIIATICLCVAVWVAPWWWTFVLLGMGMIIFRGYPEAYMLGTMLYIISYPHASFADRALFFVISFVVWALGAYIICQLRRDDPRALYV